MHKVTVPTAFTMGTDDRRNGHPMLAHKSIPNGTAQVDAYFMGYMSADLRCGDGAVLRAHGITAKEVADYVHDMRFHGLELHRNACGVKPAPACEMSGCRTLDIMLVGDVIDAESMSAISENNDRMSGRFVRSAQFRRASIGLTAAERIDAGLVGNGTY